MPRRALTTFLLALEFLTIVRLRRRAEAEPRDLGASLVWFPLVGLLIGLALAGADWLLHEKVYQASFFPEPMAVAIVILFGVVLTGAIHLDGLADTADGLFGGRTRERRLEIMRDSRIGTFGVIAILFAVLFIYLSLASTYENRRLALILVPAFARYAMVLAVVLFPYARPSGLGKAFHDYASPLALIGSTVIIAAIAYGVGVWSWDTEAGVAYVFVVVATMLVTAAAGFFVSRRLGGLTGDVYGAIGVLVEVLLFLAFRGDPYAILRSGLHPY